MKNVYLAFCGLLLLAGCNKNDDVKLVDIRQYADKVIGFSSEYGSSTTVPPEDWSAWQALNKENVYNLTPPDNYGDIEQAWTSEVTYDRQYLILGFDTVQTVSKIEIYETYNPGAIDTIYLRNASTKAWNVVYKAAPVNLLDASGNGVARIFTVNPKETSYMVDAIRVAIDVDFYGDWVEIDAMAITGRRK